MYSVYSVVGSNCAFIPKNPLKSKMKAKLISENIIKTFLNKTFDFFICKNEEVTYKEQALTRAALTY